MKKITSTTCILPWMALDRNADTSDPAFAPCCLYQSEEKSKRSFSEYWHSTELGTRRFMAGPGTESHGTKNPGKARHRKYWHGKPLERHGKKHLFCLGEI